MDNVYQSLLQTSSLHDDLKEELQLLVTATRSNLELLSPEEQHKLAQSEMMHSLVQIEKVLQITSPQLEDYLAINIRLLKNYLYDNE